jgi:hypothetical protein
MFHTFDVIEGLTDAFTYKICVDINEVLCAAQIVKFVTEGRRIIAPNSFTISMKNGYQYTISGDFDTFVGILTRFENDREDV